MSSKDEQLTEHLGVRLTPSSMKRLKAVAKKNHLTHIVYARQQVLKAIAKEK